MGVGVLTLLEALLVQSIAALLTERQRLLACAMHVLVADGAVVVFSREALFRGVLGASCDLLSCRLGVGGTNAFMSDGSRSTRGMRKDVLKLGGQESP